MLLFTTFIFCAKLPSFCLLWALPLPMPISHTHISTVVIFAQMGLIFWDLIQPYHSAETGQSLFVMFTYITLQKLQTFALILHIMTLFISYGVALHLENSTAKAYLFNKSSTVSLLSRLA